MMPFFSSSDRNVVATETLSNTASTAILTPERRFCSSSEMPSFSYVRSSSGSTSSRLVTSTGFFGAE